MDTVSFRKELLEDIIPYWRNLVGDGISFPGRIDGHEGVDMDAPKSAVMVFRMLWAFSSATRTTRSKEALECAHKMYKWSTEHFVDKENGGIFWSLNADGSPLDPKKQSYAIGFAIYGLCEYYMACGDEGAKNLAISLFESLEEHAWDSTNGGYVEALSKDWQPLEDMRLSDKDMNTVFSMNSHLHILEPYTNLYRIYPESKIKEAIQRLLTIFTDRILDKSGAHLGLFFDSSWNRLDSVISHGHDIEASWLVDEALTVTGIVDAKAEALVRDIASEAMNALCPDGHLANEKNIESGKTDTTAVWWVQAETVTGLMNMYSITNDTKYLDASSRAWEYIQNNLVDRQNGEWFWSIRENGTPEKDEDKAGFWKCPYHNTRMCTEMIQRLEKTIND
ncbi:MAG: AGE family epimerase/isomerase [Bacteroidales bacterium]|nr:AGE family epimerase/isomerase [Bacteroidales bacterium]